MMKLISNQSIIFTTKFSALWNQIYSDEKEEYEEWITLKIFTQNKVGLMIITLILFHNLFICSEFKREGQGEETNLSKIKSNVSLHQNISILLNF